jgi:integrase
MTKQRKRGQGEGSIYRRKDGRWVGVVNLGYRDGKRARKSVYGATQAEVIEGMAEARKAAREGTLVLDERQTVAQFLECWVTEAVEKSVRPSTFRRYSDLVRLHINPELGRIRLTKLTPQHVQALLNAKLGGKAASREKCGRPAEHGLSARTVHHIHGVLRTSLGQALRWGLVSRNVATLVSPPRVAHTEIRPLSVTEARKLLGEIKGHRFEALFVTALATGMRQGELLGLAWEDVDFQRKTLRVRRSLQRIEGKDGRFAGNSGGDASAAFRGAEEEATTGRLQVDRVGPRVHDEGRDAPMRAQCPEAVQGRSGEGRAAGAAVP